MNLDNEYIGRLRAAAKAYDAETRPEKRTELGAALDALAEPLSEGQLRQVAKMVNRD